MVTGGASGIGRMTAFKLAQEGAKVIIVDWDESGGMETSDRIQMDGGESVFIQTDVSQFDQVERVVDLAVQRYGDLNVMFNNAGISIMKPLLDYEPEDYDRIINVCQYGVYHGILAAGRTMSKLGTKGVIINTGSVLAFIGSKSLFSYHAAKGAVKMMTQAAAAEFGDIGIRVVGIAPGLIDTPLNDENKKIGYVSTKVNKHMRGKLIKPEQIANVAAFLGSDESDAMNGHMFYVDDGYVAFTPRD